VLLDTAAPDVRVLANVGGAARARLAGVPYVSDEPRPPQQPPQPQQPVPMNLKGGNPKGGNPKGGAKGANPKAEE
jgi:NADH-quinone oxidoreductase subunit M